MARPFGRPTGSPAALRRSSASFVLAEINSRSICAASPRIVAVIVAGNDWSSTPSDSWRCAPSRLALRPPAATPALGEWIALNERPRLRPARHPHRPSRAVARSPGLSKTSDPDHQRIGETEPGNPETYPGGGNLSQRSLNVTAHLSCACGDTRGVANRPPILEPGRVEKTGGEILSYRPSRKLQKNSCLTANCPPAREPKLTFR